MRHVLGPSGWDIDRGECFGKEEDWLDFGLGIFGIQAGFDFGDEMNFDIFCICMHDAS